MASRRLAPLLGLSALVIVAACTSRDPQVKAGPAARPTGSDTAPITGTIDWESCGDSVECGSLVVPLDADQPAAGTIRLALERHLADPAQRIGSLLVNPGGPGVESLFLAQQAESFFDQPLLDHFDIVAFDPRGVGQSEPAIDCVDDLDPFFSPDPTPDTPEERQALVDVSQKFANACAERSGVALLSHVSTREAAADMDRIRQALGEEKISYFGFSYGSELGAVWLTMFPDTVRAAVLDSAAAPNPGDQQLIDDSVALDTALGHFLSQCADDPKCAFHNDGAPAAAYSQLMVDLDQAPLSVDPKRPKVNEAIASIAVISALYDSASWTHLADDLASAQKGDGRGLLDAYDGYLVRSADGTFDNEFEALIAINCLDDPGPLTPAGVDELGREVATAAPLLGPIQQVPYVCADWPTRGPEPVQITGAGAGPVVVIGNTGDPVTPITSSRKMADALEGGVLVTVTADRHIAYGVNPCGNAAVNNYLVDLEVPADGAECP